MNRPIYIRMGAVVSNISTFIKIVKALFKTLIPIWKGGENPIIISGDTFYIKLGGDEQNVGRKQNHVMVTFCLLNEGEEVLKPDHQFRYVLFCIYIINMN